MEPKSFPDISPEVRHKRWSYGGLPVWQIAKFADRKDPEHWRFFWFSGLGWSLLIVAVLTACAIFISWKTPTEGFGCRALAQLYFLVMWIGSASIDACLYQWLTKPGYDMSRSVQKLPEGWRSERVYWITLAKDSLVFLIKR